MPEQSTCPQCGNTVDAERPCPFCAYADSIGIPTEHAVRRADDSMQLNYDLAVLHGFISSKFQLQKAIEQAFIPDMLEALVSQKLARLLMALFETEPRTEAWDANIVRTKLKAKGQLTVALDQFMAKVLEVPPPTMDQALTYLSLIKNHHGVRLIRNIGEEMQRFAQTGSAEDRHQIEKFTAETVKRLRAIQKLSVNRRINLVKDEMRGIIEDFEYRQVHGAKEILGFTIKPFNVLNQTISGLRKGFLYAIAGAPRRGKTNLTLDIATYCARENRVPVLFFTWEQTKRNLTYRLLSKECYINPDTLQRKQVLGDPLQKAKLAAGLKRMSEYQDFLYIVESTKEDTVDKVRGHAYNVMQEFDTNNIVIFVDYIQKMPIGNSLVNEKVRVEEISTALKGLSIELNCPIVAISSLSKEGCAIDMEDSEARPTMYHCKGSGDIEYDLDVACVLAKDWPDTAELTQQLRHKAEAMGKDVHRIPKIDIVNLHMEKNRDAPEGVLSTIQYFFFIEENKFIELGYKLETDVYRFNKIENLVNTLVDKDFIRFYDVDDGTKPPSARDFGWEGDADQQKAAQKKKIRLKY